MTETFQTSIFFLMFFLAHSLSAQGIELILPTPSGHYSVGTKSIEVEDSSRKPFRGAGKNRWMIQAFYPSVDDKGVYPYMPDTLETGDVEGIQVRSHAKPGATVVKGQKYPLIIFVPGLGGERQKYTILCEELASQGWVVLSFDTPYVTNFVKFSEGEKIVLTFQDAWSIPRDRDYRYRYYDEAMAYAIKNIKHTLR